MILTIVNCIISLYLIVSSATFDKDLFKEILSLAFNIIFYYVLLKQVQSKKTELSSTKPEDDFIPSESNDVRTIRNTEDG